MVKKSKGRQKIEMVKMKNKSNLQVTFSKRKFGLFKKASELCTLCGAEIAIIIFSRGGKVFSFGHPNVETMINRLLSNDPPSRHQQNEAHLNTFIRDLNSQLTQSVNQFDLEKKRNEDIKKIREETKACGHWWEKPIETLDLPHLYAFKAHLENVKKVVTLEASRFIQATVPNFYVGSSSNSAFEMYGGTNSKPNLDLSNQRRMMDVNAFNFNQNQIPRNHPFPFGNNPHGNISQGFPPEDNINYRSEFNPNENENQNQSFKREDISGYEHQHGHYPPHSGPGHF